jgi:TonB family protein
MVCREDKHQVLEAKVVKLSLDPSPDPDLFKPPQGAVERRQCDGTAQPPKPVSSPEPKYPSGTSSQFGMVTLSIVVDADGKPQDLRVRESSSKPFEKPAMAAVSRWKFRPGTCNGEPIPMEIAVQVHFQRYN